MSRALRVELAYNTDVKNRRGCDWKDHKLPVLHRSPCEYMQKLMRQAQGCTKVPATNLAEYLRVGGWVIFTMDQEVGLNRSTHRTHEVVLSCRPFNSTKSKTLSFRLK